MNNEEDLGDLKKIQMEDWGSEMKILMGWENLREIDENKEQKRRSVTVREGIRWAFLSFSWWTFSKSEFFFPFYIDFLTNLLYLDLRNL